MNHKRDHRHSFRTFLVSPRISLPFVVECARASIAGDVVILSLGPFALLPAPRTRARDEPHWHFLGPSFRYGVNTNSIVAVYAKCVSKHSRSCVCVCVCPVHRTGRTRICISAALNAYSQFMPGAAAVHCTSVTFTDCTDSTLSCNIVLC